jgi:ATP-binding cassette, subfamily B, bacterial
MREKFTYYSQADMMDCGAVCLRMVAAHYGKKVSLPYLRNQSGTGTNGASFYNLQKAAEHLGFDSSSLQLPYRKLMESPLPAILHWNRNHFVVLHKITNGQAVKKMHIADPAVGMLEYTEPEFLEHWAANNTGKSAEGFALVMEPGETFNTAMAEADLGNKHRFKKMFQYLLTQKKSLLWLLGILLVSNLLLLLLPLLTQKLVDEGITPKAVNFVWLIVAGQMVLLLGKLFVDFFYQRILLRINIRINRTILSEFISKLLRLPMSFYESKNTGDILQRIDDHYRIEHFLTGNSVNAVMSVTLFVFYSVLLIRYSISFFFISIAFSIAYIFWTKFFLSRRKVLSQQQFQRMGKNQGHLIELVQGMQEIKLSGNSNYKLGQWQQSQDHIFELEKKFLGLRQFEQVGSFLLRDFKGLLITLLVALAVINGQLSIGAMLAIQFILGQISNPVEQFVFLLQEWQDAALSFDRMQEIQDIPDEDHTGAAAQSQQAVQGALRLSNLCFAYPGLASEPVLKNINLTIEHNKVTAIVGSSGSGKTTLLKLLMKFYEPLSGSISIGAKPLGSVTHHQWRRQCAAVMQDGYIFNDTLGRNIATGNDTPDLQRLEQACRVAAVDGFLKDLPLGYDTLLGEGGINLSKGQRQRLLIARAVYKNPDILFFDEATNALDANNEKKITDNLELFFASKTVIIVAHRLSTVKNADKIVVMEKGAIIEQGTHRELIARGGAYYELIRNQLDLGE